MGIHDTKTINMSEKFCLKWNDFSSNASKSFELFRNEEYLQDVTLISDDQHQVTAHKLVLPAASEYFKNIFKKNKAPNPFLCLDGISSTDLNNILNYIYNGEVQIFQENLDRFLNVAQRFKLEGLLGDRIKEEKEEHEKEIIVPSSNPPSKIRKLDKAKSEQTHTFTESTSIQLNYTPMDSNDLQEIDQKLYEHMEKNSDGKYSCKMCAKNGLDKTNMKLHVESHVEGLSFLCNTCGKDFRSRKALKNHNSKNHRQ